MRKVKIIVYRSRGSFGFIQHFIDLLIEFFEVGLITGEHMAGELNFSRSFLEPRANQNLKPIKLVLGKVKLFYINNCDCLLELLFLMEVPWRGDESLIKNLKLFAGKFGLDFFE